MKRKDGGLRSDYDQELDDIILDVIFQKKRINADRIRKIINKKYLRRVGWITIKRHLDNLISQKKIKIFYESGDNEKKIRVYTLT